ncbi:four helix bundle protein [Hoylesella pleuritidis]|jgi:TIGR02436 family protein|uniref:Four helix bundle protein n=3 Tax=Hoylesella pleuritidis TaxID=407975 RepID=U2MRE0_9BACT|nr:four helix bundle protein [Hoylesella pleuritidis]ERK04215.1 four helix bundle protein [Hoylesella pleuritidis F0068]
MLHMKDINENIIVSKSMEFAVRCVRLCMYLQDNKREDSIFKQLFRSGTSIDANVKEAIRIQSRADFRAKMNISLKEASETEYWIEPLRNTNYITKLETNSLLTDCVERIKYLQSLSRRRYQMNYNSSKKQ